MSKFKEQIEANTQYSLVDEIDLKLDEESKKDFYECLKNTKVSVPVIVEALKGFGIETSIGVIQRWRKDDRVPNTVRRKAKQQ